MVTCKNCNNEFEGSYCNRCGQPAETHKMNFPILVHDIQQGLLPFDKGLFFTIRELFTRPGYSIREYLAGKRVQHIKPISLVLVLAGILGLLSHYFHFDMLGETFQINGTDGQAEEVRKSVNEISDWVSDNYAIVSLVLLPVFTLGTFLSFRKRVTVLLSTWCSMPFSLDNGSCSELFSVPVLLPVEWNSQFEDFFRRCQYCHRSSHFLDVAPIF